MMDAVVDDMVALMATFLSAVDLLHLSQTSRGWRSLCDQDPLWKDQCQRRWRIRVTKSLLRKFSVPNFFRLYWNLHRRQYSPETKYMARTQIVWGRNRKEGADAWLTVAHAPDCKVVTRHGISYIQLRLTIQNFCYDQMTIDIQDLRIHMKDGSRKKAIGAGEGSESLFASLAPRVLAANGQEVNGQARQPSRWMLKLYDFVVISFNVSCDECNFEADFLEQCSFVWLPIRRPGPCKDLHKCRCGLIPDGYHLGDIRVPVVDESVIWKHYTCIASGFVVLNCRNPLQAELPTQFLV